MIDKSIHEKNYQVKKLLIVVIALISVQLIYSQSITRKVIASAGGYYNGNDINVSYTIGEPIINTLSNNDMIITQGFQQSEEIEAVFTLILKAYLEGFYRGGEMMDPSLFNLGLSNDPTVTDTVQADLWSPDHVSSPYPAYTSKSLLHSNGDVSFSFAESALNHPYYIAIKHRNSIETWTANPVMMNNAVSYDFTSSLGSAYSDNINPPMKQVAGGKFALFSGDINQDGTADAIDLQITENDAYNFAFGYNFSDCNGDGASDALDMQIIENNASLFLFIARPTQD